MFIVYLYGFIFNMLKLGEGELIGETPVRTHKIIKAEVSEPRR